MGDGIVNKAVSGLVLETGLTPCMKKLSVGNNKTDVGDAAGGVEPQPKRERKSKSSPKVKKISAKSEDEKTGDEAEKKAEEKIAEVADPETPKTPNKAIEKGDEKSLKETQEKVAESPKVENNGEKTSEKDAA